MGFYDSLRMNSIYPPAPRNGVDPLMEMINTYKSLAPTFGQETRPMGLNTVGNSIANPQQIQQPMNVVLGEQSNPGADILARAKQPSTPTITNAGQALAKAGMKPNDQKLPGSDDVDTELKRELTKSQITKNLDPNSKLKVVTITDPNDPTKQISANYDSETGAVTPLKLPDGGVITSAMSPKDRQAKIDNDKRKSALKDSIRTKAKAAIEVLNELADPKTGELTDKGQWTSGVSDLTGVIPFTPAYSGQTSKIRLKNLLTLDLLQELKTHSQSGATGFGQMNLRELGVLVDAASKLDRYMNEDELKTETDRIRGYLNQIISPGPDDTEDSSTGDIKPVSSHDSSRSNSSGLTPPPAPEGVEWVRRSDNKGWTAQRKVGK